MQTRTARLPAVAVLGGVAALGAVLGAGWDLLHVHTRTTVYSIGLDRQPLWVPLQFAGVYTFGVLAMWKLGVTASDATMWSVGFEAAWVTVAYAATAVGHSRELLVVAVLAAGLIVRVRTFRSLSRPNVIAAVPLIVAGPLVEATLIQAGLFRYTTASLGSIPLWLPLLYASAVPFALALGTWTRRLKRSAWPNGGREDDRPSFS